jgi:hypothetical protein
MRVAPMKSPNLRFQGEQVSVEYDAKTVSFTLTKLSGVYNSLKALRLATKEQGTIFEIDSNLNRLHEIADALHLQIQYDGK